MVELRAEVKRTVEEALEHLEERAADGDARLREVEREVRAHVFAFGCALLVLFFALVEQRVLAAHAKGTRFDWFGRSYRVAPAIGRGFSTLFGVLRYHRVYMREVADHDRHGFHPLDLALGLGSDRFSWNVLASAVRLATKLSFAEARSIHMALRAAVSVHRGGAEGGLGLRSALCGLARTRTSPRRRGRLDRAPPRLQQTVADPLPVAT